MMCSKPRRKRPPNRDKTKILMTNGSLMKDESIAEGEHSAILLTYVKLKSVLKTNF